MRVAARHPYEVDFEEIDDTGEAPAEPLPRVDVSIGSQLRQSFALPNGTVTIVESSGD